MAHPHRGEALSSSRQKMRAVTGVGGGGTPHMGMSPFKRAAAGGEIKSYHSHDKSFVSPTVGDGKVKRRADKFARGGRAGMAKGGKPGGPGLYPAGSEYKHKPSGNRYEWEQVGTHDVPKDQPLKRGGRTKMDTGGMSAGAAKRLGQRIKAEQISPGMGRAIGAQDAASGRGEGFLHGDAIRGPISGEGPEYKKGGRHKRADGGRLMGMGQGPQRKSVRGGKGKGNVNIAIMMPERHHPAAGPPAGLGGPPPGGAGSLAGPGGPGGAPAAAPLNPLAGMGPGGVGAGGMPGMPPGANPAAMQALAGIAGGAGGPMGAGLPGRGPFARGGKTEKRPSRAELEYEAEVKRQERAERHPGVDERRSSEDEPFARGGVAKSTGLSSNLQHWKDYANQNVRGNKAHARGATGESEELPLRTPSKQAKRASITDDYEVARKRGDRGPIKRARGGKIPVKTRGGSETGVGRRELAKNQPSWR